MSSGRRALSNLNVCVNMAVVYWSRQKNIDIVPENKFRVCILR